MKEQCQGLKMNCSCLRCAATALALVLKKNRTEPFINPINVSVAFWAHDNWAIAEMERDWAKECENYRDAVGRNK